MRISRLLNILCQTKRSFGKYCPSKQFYHISYLILIKNNCSRIMRQRPNIVNAHRLVPCGDRTRQSAFCRIDRNLIPPSNWNRQGGCCLNQFQLHIWYSTWIRLSFKTDINAKQYPPPKREIVFICEMASATIISILSANGFCLIGSRRPQYRHYHHSTTY